MNSEKKLLCFDYDGVIADTREIVIDVLREAMTERGLVSELTAAGLAALHDVSFPEIVRISGAPDELRHEILEQIPSLIIAHQDKIRPFAAIPEILFRLAEKHELVVISGSAEKVLRTILEKEELLGCFTEILGADTSGTKAEKLRKLVDARPGSQERTWMIGDSGSDVRAAREASVDSVAVLWGWQTEALLTAEQPSRIARIPSDLLFLL